MLRSHKKCLKLRGHRLAVLINNFSTDINNGYHGLNSSKNKTREEWVQTKEELDQERLDIDGHPVMQRWETPFMGELAKVVASNGGKVMEVGFGMGISASAVQKYPIAEHIILEANADVYSRLLAFKKAAPRLVTPIGPALWQNSLRKVPDNSIDGILYDTYPLVKEEQHIHQFDFIKEAFCKLKPGGILTYCNLTSLGVLRPTFCSWEELFEKTQLPHLLNCGFLENDLDFKVVPVVPTSDCEYYQVDTALVPICKKPCHLDHHITSLSSAAAPSPPSIVSNRMNRQINEAQKQIDKLQVYIDQIEKEKNALNNSVVSNRKVNACKYI